MIDSVSVATRSGITCFPLSGLTPPFANVDAMTARSSVVTRIEHCRKYTSVASSTDWASTPLDLARIGEGAIAVTGQQLGLEHVLVDVQLVAGAVGQELADTFEPVCCRGARDERRGDDRAGVDQRVGRPTGDRVEADRVERFTAGLEADVVTDLVEPDFADRQRVHERLGHRLDREPPERIARAVHMAVDAGERDAEAVRVLVGQFGDVVRERAGVIGAMTLDHLLECVGDRIRGDRSQGPDQRDVEHDHQTVCEQDRQTELPVVGELVSARTHDHQVGGRGDRQEERRRAC